MMCHFQIHAVLNESHTDLRNCCLPFLRNKIFSQFLLKRFEENCLEETTLTVACLAATTKETQIVLYGSIFHRFSNISSCKFKISNGLKTDGLKPWRKHC